MKYANFKSFVKHLESAGPDHFAPVYLILAKDSFEIQSAVLQIQEKALVHEPLKSFDSTHAAEAVGAELNSFSMFGGRKIIALHRVDKASMPLKKLVESYLENPANEVILVLTASSLAASTKFYKALEKKGVVLNLTGPEKPWEKESRMVDWAAWQAAQSDKQLDRQGALVLIRHVGTDASLLHSELEKLICYVGSRRQITEKDIDTLCPVVNQETVWQLGEAIFHSNASKAIRIGKDLLNNQVPLIVLLRQIRKQFQTGCFVGSVLASGSDQADITKEFPYMRGRILQQHVQTAKTYGIERFAKGIAAIDRTEVEAKNSSAADEALFELLIARLT